MEQRQPYYPGCHFSFPKNHSPRKEAFPSCSTMSKSTPPSSTCGRPRPFPPYAITLPGLSTGLLLSHPPPPTGTKPPIAGFPLSSPPNTSPSSPILSLLSSLIVWNSSPPKSWAVPTPSTSTATAENGAIASQIGWSCTPGCGRNGFPMSAAAAGVLCGLYGITDSISRVMSTSVE